MSEVYLKPLHISMSVKDLDESMKWYGEHLGFHPVFSMYIPAHRARLAFMRHGDFDIELVQHDDTKPIPRERLDPHEDQMTQGTKHIAFLTDDVDALIGRLESEGVEIAAPPKIMENAEAGVREKICFIRDRDGIAIEFIERMKYEESGSI
jgi:catechol 2,3-dioxygenase-like lactoylglutathione lyase family enzyme